MPLLLNEHKRFAAVCDALRELCDALGAGVSSLPARLEPASLVSELGRVLGRHFAVAEEYLERVAAQRVDLLPAVVDLKGDHAVLSRELRDLELVVADEARWGELPKRIGSLLNTLAVHREGEALLVRAAAQSAKSA